ncbi:hypothetical protein DFJ73DRAFT_354599 [Zopfochytrium polystomum]|nr:hypothetical protein DFJ73DRAFT_354599 [Zopfochytrium polystomum]
MRRGTGPCCFRWQLGCSPAVRRVVVVLHHLTNWQAQSRSMRPFTSLQTPAAASRMGLRFSAGRFVSSASRPPPPSSKPHIAAFLGSLSPARIPRENMEQSFSRSSGPGGQNVNKVNTKVEVRFSLDDAKWIPPEVRERMRIMPGARVSKDGQYIVTSDRHRTQSQNVDDCFAKLFAKIVEAGEIENPKETSEETVKRIQKFKAVEKEMRHADKRKRSSVKASRQSGGWRDKGGDY